MLGPVKACLVHLVGEHVFCLRSPDGEIQASKELSGVKQFVMQPWVQWERAGSPAVWLAA
jgi:hypothetical protein